MILRTVQMANVHRESRRIALFVEGETERGDARQKTLPVFFRKWLDPQLPDQSKVGIHAVNFKGVSNYLYNLSTKVEMYLTDNRANYVFGLVDLYGLPPDRFDFSDCTSVKEKVIEARRVIRALIPPEFSSRFRQHFSVHEVEAWLLAYPEKFKPKVRARIKRRKHEDVNFDEPPAKLLKKILGSSYKKTVTAKNIFPNVDPQIAIDKCPYLKLLAEDLLAFAKRLQ